MFPEKVYPAVNLNLAVFPSLAARSFINCLHQRIRGQLTGITDDRCAGCAADLPIGRWEMAVNRMAAVECAWIGLRRSGECRRACPIALETRRPDVSRMVRAVFFLRCSFRLFFLALGFRLLLLGLGSCFLPRPPGGICCGPFFFSQYFLAFI